LPFAADDRDVRDMRRRVVQGAGVNQLPHHDLAAFKAAFARDKGITVSAR
jgi:hypothetical protein